MGSIKNKVTDCFVAEVGAGVLSEKHIIKKTAAADPFTAFSQGDLIRVYNADYTKSGDMYVLRASYVNGGDYEMVLGSTAITLADCTVSLDSGLTFGSNCVGS